MPNLIAEGEGRWLFSGALLASFQAVGHDASGTAAGGEHAKPAAFGRGSFLR